MIYTWEELIEQKPDFIELIWYGSLLNSNTHNYNKVELKAVLVKWFRRIYNIKMIPDNYSIKWINNFRKYLKKYWITKNEEIIELNKKNLCALNCEFTWDNQIMNWLLIKIYSKYLYELSLREE